MGIGLGSQFTVNTTLPIDDRMTAADATARDAIASGRRFEGMVVFVVADGKNYQLKGGIANANWVVTGGGEVPNIAGSNTDSTVSTAATLTAPTNAVGFILTNLDTSSANIRWRIGSTATTTSGQQLQPGRDTGYIPCGANISICAESGTQNYNIQWIQSS